MSTFYCSVTNYSCFIIAKVQFVQKPQHRYNIALGRTLKVNCSAHASPPPKIIWKFLGINRVNDGNSRIQAILVKTTDPNTVKSTLVIEDVRREDNGVAQCKAINSFSDAVFNTTITVLGKMF